MYRTRWFVALLVLAACQSGGDATAPPTSTFAPTALVVTPAPAAPSLTPDTGQLEKKANIRSLGPVGETVRPRLHVDDQGTAHLLRLAYPPGKGAVLQYSRWLANDWTLPESVQTWEFGAPGQTDLVIDSQRNVYALWSEPGELLIAQRTEAGWGGPQAIPLEVGADHAASFEAVANGGELYIVYRDGAPDTPHLRLGYSPYSGQAWEAHEVILPDPGRPSAPAYIGMAAQRDGTLHLVINLQRDNQIYLYRPKNTEDWQGLFASQDVFDEGAITSHIQLDSEGHPHLLLHGESGVYYRYWNGTAWTGPSAPVLNARGVLQTAFVLAPDGLAWVLGDGATIESEPGLWLRTVKANEAGAPQLLAPGSVTEVAIDAGQELVHMLAVVNGELYHIYVETVAGSALPRQPAEMREAYPDPTDAAPTDTPVPTIDKGE